MSELHHRFQAVAVASVFIFAGYTGSVRAYIDIPPATLGRLCNSSMNITILRVEKIDRDGQKVIFKAIKDLKGNSPGDFVKAALETDAKIGVSLLKWCDVGREAVFFASAARNAGYLYADGRWHFLNCANGPAQWWRLTRIESNMVQAYAGEIKELIAAVVDVVGGKEVVVPCRVPIEGKKGADEPRRIRASLKRLDFDMKRDLLPK